MRPVGMCGACDVNETDVSACVGVCTVRAGCSHTHGTVQSPPPLHNAHINSVFT